MKHLGLSNRASIWVASSQIILLFMLSTLPTPLYATYAAKFHLSGLLLAMVFAAYTLGTISTLLFLGRLSDQVGRRPISLLAITAGIAAALLFIFVTDPLLLFLARITTGFATGLAAGTAIAWVRDLYGSGKEQAASQLSVTVNIFGLGFGPLLAGLLATFAPAPTTLTYIVFIACLLILSVGVLLASETVKNQSRITEISLKPRFGVPRDLRYRFLAPALTIFVTFSLVGFYSAVAPGLLTKVLDVRSLAAIGGVVFELFLAGTIAAYTAFRLASRQSMLLGIAIMLPTLILLVVSLQLHSLMAMVIGTALGGSSLGFAYRGSLEVVNQIAPADRRAEMVSSLFVVGNLSFAIPVIGIGILAALTSQHLADLTFTLVIAVLSLLGLYLGQHLRIEAAP